MLVITRKKGEAILLGDNIEVTIISCEGGNVKLAINAPRDISILRKELYEEVKEENRKAKTDNLNILKGIEIHKTK